MKKSGSAVFLMELTLVILFFSLSTVVTLRLFVAAHQQERRRATGRGKIGGVRVMRGGIKQEAESGQGR